MKQLDSVKFVKNHWTLLDIQSFKLENRKPISLTYYLVTGTGGAVCKGATPSVEQPGGRGFKPRLRSLLD
jgi:hypothetical protein